MRFAPPADSNRPVGSTSAPVPKMPILSRLTTRQSHVPVPFLPVP